MPLFCFDASMDAGMQDFFELFGLNRRHAIEVEALDRAYREIQAQVHPDRHAAGGDAVRRASVQWTTRVNEAYRTLKDPLWRARHLLELNGVDPALETNTAMPGEFLAQQMLWREELEQATQTRDTGALMKLEAELAARTRAMHEDLTECIDVRADYAKAAEVVRGLMFLRRLTEEIREATEALEA